MSYQSLFCYGWDLAEADSLNDLAARFRERGINAITFAAAYHAGKFLRPHGQGGKVYFPEDGTAYFKTDATRYGEIKPQENSIVAGRDMLRECCELPDIDVTAWMVLLHNSRVGSEHRHHCVHNAFGDSYLYSLCPSSPEVRDYAVALCCDVAEKYPVAGLTLETPGFLPYQHGYHHEFALVRLNDWLSNMLGLCFCDHCVAAASEKGIDAKGLRARAAKAIDDYLDADFDLEEDMASALWQADTVMDADLSAFLRFRCDQVTSLVSRIRKDMPGDKTLSIIPSVARPTGGSWYEGTDLAALAEVADYIEACFYEPSVSRIAGDLHDIARRIGGTSKLRGIIRPAFPDLQSAGDVAGAVETLRHGGMQGISFYNYGHLKRVSLEWMGAALTGKSA